MSWLRILTILVCPVAIASGLWPDLAISQDAAGQRTTAAQLGPVIDRLCTEVEPRVIAWRRDIHQHPELSNREVRTAKLVADHLRSLGLTVETGVARTGVVAVITGGRP